jgi:transforming growth factor-beta-induced protein
VLTPVKYSLKELVQRDPRLSTMAQVLEGVDLSESGHYTLLAPTDDAFARLSPSVRDKILRGHGCGKDVIKQHVLPNIICSSVVQGRVRTKNSLNEYVRMSRGDADELLVESATVLQRDVMATNGVLYVIDQVILPAGAEDILEVVERLGGAQFMRMLSTSGLDRELQDMDNFTVLLPSNDAIEDDEETSLDSMDNAELRRILANHIIPQRLTNRQLYNNRLLSTTNGRDSLRVKEYRSFPFGAQSAKTIQCVPIINADVETCGGMVHVVDKLIVPPVRTVLELLERNADFSRVLALIRAANLTDLLKGDRPLTFFAPTNKAFTALSADFLKQINDDKVKARKVLLSHMISDVLCCSGVFSSQFFVSHEATLDGWLVGIDRSNSAGVLYDTVPVQTCDRTASNGVVHAVDAFAPTVLSRYGTSSGSARRRGGHQGRFRLEDIWSIFD